MKVADFLADVSQIIGDEQRVFWSSDELLAILNEGLNELALKTGYFIKEQQISTTETQNSYTIDTASYKIVEATDSNGLKLRLLPYTLENKEIKDNSVVLVKSPNELYFTSPRNDTITVRYAYTPNVQVGGDLELPNFAADGLKYFVAGYCYMRDRNTENLQKSHLYLNMFERAARRLADLAVRSYNSNAMQTQYVGF